MIKDVTSLAAGSESNRFDIGDLARAADADESVDLIRDVGVLDCEGSPYIVGSHFEVLVVRKRVDDCGQTGLESFGLSQRLGMDVASTVVLLGKQGDDVVDVELKVRQMLGESLGCCVIVHGSVRSFLGGVGMTRPADP